MNMTDQGSPSVHYSELPPAKPGDEFYPAWNTYLRAVSRLLTEGHQGRVVLIKDDAIIGIFDDGAAALKEAYSRFLGERFLVHQISEFEPVLRVRGLNLPWGN